MTPVPDKSGAERTSNHDNAKGRVTPDARYETRREVLRKGAKLAYLTPVVLSLSAQQALAASLPSGMCSTAQQTGEPCFTDTDCCSGKCDFGACR